jgi:tetratricopeptide (TPR) repeat protein
MTSSQLETEEYLAIDKHYYEDKISDLCDPALIAFKTIIKSYAMFHALFISLCLVEFVFILLGFTFLAKTSYLAVSLAVFFLTLFTYFVLRIYLNTKKPGQLVDLRDHLLKECKTFLNYQEGRSDHHIALAGASCKLGAALKGVEYNLYKVPPKLESFSNVFQKISCWAHAKDVHDMRELLFLAAINEHIKFIKFEPTNLEAHASLANTYVLLSSLYSDPRKSQDFNENLWVPSYRFDDEMQRKFIASAERAIEEFKILNDYAPNDPWVHTQLAYSYQDLQMPLEEIKEYEMILKICPNDNETLFKLGVLYFEQGFNAKGLQVYEELKRVHYKKAEDLIRFYGSYNPSN